MLLVTPKHDANIFFIYQTGRNSDCASILLRTRLKSSSKMSENAKNDFFGPVFQISLVIKLIECHQSQTVCTLAKHIQKGSTTSTLKKKTFPHDNFSVPQVKFSCDFYFFQFWSCCTRNKASGRNIIWRIAPFHVLKRCHP